jgi:hypothetical protein
MDKVEEALNRMFQECFYDGSEKDYSIVKTALRQNAEILALSKRLAGWLQMQEDFSPIDPDTTEIIVQNENGEKVIYTMREDMDAALASSKKENG